MMSVRDVSASDIGKGLKIQVLAEAPADSRDRVITDFTCIDDKRPEKALM